MSLEFLQVADAVAREKDIERDMVLEAMEQAIQMAARRKYGLHLNIHAHIDRLDGTVTMKKVREVVETVMAAPDAEEIRLAQRELREPHMEPAIDDKGKPVQENEIQLTVKAAQKYNPNAKLGDVLMEDLPPMDFGRIAAQAAKQVIVQKVRDAERVKEFDEYKNRSNQVVSGVVKRADARGVIIDLGGAEAFLPRDEMIPRETYKQGDRVRAYIYKVERQMRGPQIFASRTHPQLLIELFREAVPEVESGVIEILAAARDPGFRAKIAVKSFDRNVDPVGACVGVRGTRVQTVTNELQGERVDIIEWSQDPAQFLIRAIAPAEVTKVVLDEEAGRIEVVVPEDKLSLAIGRRGQNVRLASILTGWDIDIMSEQEESDKRAKESALYTEHFMSRLDVDETLARLLIAEGFTSVDELLMISAAELGGIEGLDGDIAVELQSRAQAWIDEQEAQIKKYKVTDELRALEGISTDVLVALGKNKLITLDDLAELATDELLELVPEGSLPKDKAEKLIMAARQHWFEDEATEEGADVPGKPEEVPAAPVQA